MSSLTASLTTRFERSSGHGRNLTLLRYPQCTRLVQVGLPNRLRGEMWETLSGSIYLRFSNPGYYERLLEENKGKTNISTDDIEKDLHRSLPEYAGYQSEEGISSLRRVLRAYSYMNPELGYCQVQCHLHCRCIKMLTRLQAMNILAAAILMYDEVFAHESVVELTFSYPAICQRNKRFGCWRYYVGGYSLDITREMPRFLC